MGKAKETEEKVEWVKVAVRATDRKGRRLYKVVQI
jgi:hypothetical protein